MSKGKVKEGSKEILNASGSDDGLKTTKKGFNSMQCNSEHMQHIFFFIM